MQYYFMVFLVQKAQLFFFFLFHEKLLTFLLCLIFQLYLILATTG